MKRKIVLSIMAILTIASIVYAETYIPKGSKFFCPSCGEWIATANRDLYEHEEITTEMFDAIWSQGIHCPLPITAYTCVCSYAVYPAISFKKNWKLTSN